MMNEEVFNKMAQKGETHEVMDALRLLADAYVDQCGISMTYRTVVYCALERWLQKLACSHLPLAEKAKRCYQHEMLPLLSRAYIAEVHDRYDICHLDSEELRQTCVEMISNQEVDMVTGEVLAWGILDCLKPFVPSEITATIDQSGVSVPLQGRATQMETEYRNAPKVIVAGGRDFDDYEMMSRKLSELFNNDKQFTGHLVKIISGMADGADTLALRYADENRLPKIMMPACWQYDKRRAGFLRNEDMLSIADALVAFWNGESHGTKHMIEISKDKGIPIWVFEYKRNNSNRK